MNRSYFTKLIVAVCFVIFLTGCITMSPVTHGQITLPKSFEEVWYRPTLGARGFIVMLDTGTVTVDFDVIEFHGKKEIKRIPYETMQEVSLGKGFDFINKWVVIKYRDGEIESYALFCGGKALGWGGFGTAARIFQAVNYALEQKSLGAVVQR